MLTLIRPTLFLGALACSVASMAQWSVIPSGTTDSLTAITWVDDRFLIAGGDGVFLRSMDNGVSFAPTAGYTPGAAGNPFDHLLFYDSLSGYGTTPMTCCELQRTTDGGQTWTALGSSPASGPLVLPFNDSDLVVFRVGPGVAFSSTGQLAYEPLFPVVADIDSICNHILSGGCDTTVSGDDTTIYTNSSWGWTLSSADRGATYHGGTFPYGYYPYTAQALGGDTIAYVDLAMQLRISTDAGLTWSQGHEVPSVGSWIDPGIHLLDTQTALAVDDGGQVELTHDAGASWQLVPTPTMADLKAVLFLDEFHVLSVGDAGTILVSSDGGQSWTEEESGTDVRLHALARSGDAVIAVGSDGTILRRYPAYDGFPLAIADNAAGQLLLAPVPANDVLTVSLDQGTTLDGTLRITDQLGRMHAVNVMGRSAERVTLDVSGLRTGVYAVEAGTMRGRFVVAR